MRPIHVSAIAGLSVTMFGAAQAEIEGSIHAGINTEYIWRGVDQSFGFGSNSMWESGVDVGTSWNNIDLAAGVWYASVHGQATFDEIDYYASATYNVGECCALTVGYIYYDFPSTPGSPVLNQEVYFGIGTSLWDIDLGATYYWDIEGDNDGYSELTADYTYEINECWAANLGLTLSYDWETSDIHHYGASLSLDYAFNDVLTISPYISATSAEDGAEDGVLGWGYGPDGPVAGDELFGGVIVSAAW